MTFHFQFRLKKEFSLEHAIQELESVGGKEIYCIEELAPHSYLLGAFFCTPPKCLNSLEILSENAPLDIDWENQWRQNTQVNEHGLLTLDLDSYKKNTPPIQLLPGAGFGDLTHPTTRLMLRLLASSSQDQTVLDIGCGSGILSLAALKMGAKTAYAIDIDEKALAHAKKNCVLNHLENCIFVSKNFENKTFILHPLILMNMIISEQIEAWNSLPFLHHQKMEILTSGVLKSQRISYLNTAKNWNWNLLQEIEEEQWMAFRFNLIE